MTTARPNLPDRASRQPSAASLVPGVTQVGQDLHSVCSVSALARKLGLSRSRLYQLQQAGVLPPPVYCIHTRRPFYHELLQQICLEIRRSGISYDGQPVAFYQRRKKRTKKPSLPNTRHSCAWLTDVLRRQLGMKVTRRQIKQAVETLFPAGLDQSQDESAVINALLKYFGKRRWR